MEEEKSGGGSPGTVGAEETKKHGTAAAVQNGEQAEEKDTRKAGFVRRNSSEPPGKMEAGKTVIPTEEPPRKRFQIPRKTKKGGAPLPFYRARSSRACRPPATHRGVMVVLDR